MTDQDLITNVKAVGLCSVCSKVLTETEAMTKGELRPQWGELCKTALLSSPACPNKCIAASVKVMVSTRGQLLSGEEVFA